MKVNALLMAAVLAAGVSGGAFTAAGWWAYDTFIDDPQIVRIEQAKAASLMEAAAAKATRDEQARQFKVGEVQFQKSYERALEDEAWQQAKVNLLQAEIADYERERQAAGIGQGLVRVAVGLEDVRDIVADTLELPRGAVYDRILAEKGARPAPAKHVAADTDEDTAV